MSSFYVKVKGLPIQVYAETAKKAELSAAYIEKTIGTPDLSPAAQSARMANALYEAKLKDKNNKNNERTEDSQCSTPRSD